MEKKEYETPKMEIIEMPFDGRLLDSSVGAGIGDCPDGADDCYYD